MKKSLCVTLFVLFSMFSISGCSDLNIDYEFNSGQNFTEIQGVFGNKDTASYKGYMYYFSSCPVIFSHPWSSATLHSPAPINGGNDMLQCYFVEDGWSKTLNFYCGGDANSPTKPPEGSYQVNVGSKSYNFNGMTSRSIDPAMNDVYVPVIKLSMDGSGKISLIEWQWWKKSGGSWSQPGDTELASKLENAGFETSSAGWVGDRVNGDIALITNGSVTPPAQSFTPGVFRMHYRDKDGYSYGFDWR